jgi:enoyl-CoA hydratase
MSNVEGSAVDIGHSTLDIVLMLDLSEHHGIATVRLEHGKANALDLELVRALGDAIQDLERRAVRGLILTGRGTIFSAGVDLPRLLDGGAKYVRAFLPALVETLRRLFAFEGPAVAAINGHAIAGGCVLAAACDYRLMARGGGTIGVPELRVGLPFPLVAIEILRFATSTAHLQELVYRGVTYDVAQASERGLVDEVVEPEALLDRARAVAEGFAAEPVARFRLTKRQLRGPALAAVEGRAMDSDNAVLAEWTRPETMAAIRRYLDELKRARGR